MAAMPRRKSAEAGAPQPDERFSGFGRYAGPATLILFQAWPKVQSTVTPLAKDVEQFAGVRLAPGTLYRP